MENDDGQEALLNNQLNEQRTLNGRLLASVTNADRDTNRLSSKGQAHRAGMVKGWYFHVIFYSVHSRLNKNIEINRGRSSCIYPDSYSPFL